MNMNADELRSFLDEKVLQYNKPDFIESDPIQIPHLFTQKEDIEIAGFLAASFYLSYHRLNILKPFKNSQSK